jgi:hypothetical protein
VVSFFQPLVPEAYASPRCAALRSGTEIYLDAFILFFSDVGDPQVRLSPDEKGVAPFWQGQTSP